MEKLNFVALDFEYVTVVGDQYPKHVTQVGIVRVENGAIVERYSSYIKPLCSKKEFDKDFHAKRKTGIRYGMLEDKPTFVELWDSLFDKLNGNLVVAHNARGADLAALTNELERNNISRSSSQWPLFDVICTCTISSQIWSQKESGLEVVCDKLDIPIDQHHDACCDAECAAKIYMKLHEILPSNQMAEERLNFDCNYKKSIDNRPRYNESQCDCLADEEYSILDLGSIDIPNGLYSVAGKNIVLTCFGSSRIRECLKEVFESVGATIQTSSTVPNGRTDLMLIGSVGSAPKKEERAKELGVEIIDSLSDFIDSFELTEDFIDQLNIKEEDFKNH